MSYGVKVECPRCGQAITSGMLERHKKTCDNLPKPTDLARKYRRSGLTVGEFSRDYPGRSEWTIRKWIWLGYKQVYPDEDCGFDMSGYVKEFNPNFVACESCGINASEDSGGDGARCRFCLMDARGTDYMSLVLGV